jgi:beta-glucanase (GH16 family)
MRSLLSQSRYCSWLLLILSGINVQVSSQERRLVWADEFNGTSVDRSVWQFESGPSNDNIHFYTDRPENAKISDGMLQIIALEEPYQGYAYTSAHIRTEMTRQWRYGRVEARIRVPGTPGFVPAFWMLPADQRYGWWPNSGEIDIMEHPSNEVTRIYGTVHTETYNLFSGSQPPQGGVAEVPDAETAFHLYAAEWTPEGIDFYVDEQLYYYFSNDNGGPTSWPFDHPFYLILNLAVGGGWVGNPDETTVFPAIMEVDYVRVYQHPGEIEIQGAGFVTYNTEGVPYHLEGMEGTDVEWSVPGGAQIVSGQGTQKITVDWGVFGGDVIAEYESGGENFVKSLPVRVSPSYVKNTGFEKGVKHWVNTVGYPSKGSFSLRKEEVHSGHYSIFAEVTDAGGNPWDVQLSQQDLLLQGGTLYEASISVISEGAQEPISAAVINASDFSLIGQHTFTPGQDWEVYKFEFTAPSDMPAAFNIDVGGHTGTYYFDDVSLTTASLSELNLLKNPDFFQGEQAWELLNLSDAVSEGSAASGEYAVSITIGGINAWDIHLGQGNLPLENGFEYLFAFDAYASAPRQIIPLVGIDGEPWTVYTDIGPVSLTTNRQTFTFNFTMEEPTDLQARLGFDIGGEIPEVYFDNILLRKGAKAPTSLGKPSQSAAPIHGLHHSPNPVKGKTFFHYTLDEPGHVRLQLFNISGQMVAEVVNEFQEEGERKISWRADDLPPGLYLYRFETGEGSDTRKMVVIR